jgi:hypothetical protein
MSFNVSEFLKNAQGHGGFGRTAHFEIQLTLPSFLKNNTKYNGLADHLTLSAVSANLPGVSIDAAVTRRGSTSFKESYPINVTYSDLSVSFLSDGEGLVLNLFKDWIDFIFPTADSESSHNARSLVIPYRQEYATTITLKHFSPDAANKSIMKYTFHEIFPEKIGDVPFNWGAFNDIVTLPVDFKYTYYTQE